MSSTTDPLAALTTPTRHLFLSPHYDDIPLSAGGAVRLLADHGHRPETLIVFGSEPDPASPLSPFAQAMHAGWGLTASQVIASRQAEERAATTLLGARHRVLPFRDAIYREQHYLSNDDLFGAPATAEQDLPRRIAASLDLPGQPDPATRLYAPLAIGHHVDHQLVFQTAAFLARHGWDVWFYEDTPYALIPGAVEGRLEEVARTTAMSPAASVPVAQVWDAKLDAILSYPSQLETIFLNYVGVGTSREEISAALERRARLAGEGDVVERYWKINHASSRAGS